MSKKTLPVALKQWRDSCDKYGKSIPKRGSPEYKLVKKHYDLLRSGHVFKLPGRPKKVKS